MAPPPTSISQVLVVEDDRDIRETVAEVLEEEGYQVRSAENGRDALDYLLAAGKLPDVILLDLMMPVMDGWTFWSELQTDVKLAALPIVVISADASVHEKAARLHPVACLRKPVSVDELLSVVAPYRR